MPMGFLQLGQRAFFEVGFLSDGFDGIIADRSSTGEHNVDADADAMTTCSLDMSTGFDGCASMPLFCSV